jgi:hypothetical protein
MLRKRSRRFGRCRSWKTIRDWESRVWCEVGEDGEREGLVWRMVGRLRGGRR